MLILYILILYILILYILMLYILMLYMLIPCVLILHIQYVVYAIYLYLYTVYCILMNLYTTLPRKDLGSWVYISSCTPCNMYSPIPIFCILWLGLLLPWPVPMRVVRYVQRRVHLGGSKVPEYGALLLLESWYLYWYSYTSTCMRSPKYSYTYIVAGVSLYLYCLHMLPKRVKLFLPKALMRETRRAQE
jgi:hypothetical protein